VSAGETPWIKSPCLPEGDDKAKDGADEGVVRAERRRWLYSRVRSIAGATACVQAHLGTRSLQRQCSLAHRERQPILQSISGCAV